VQSKFFRWPWPEVLILALALVLRVVALDMKPPHFDEGVNGWFADRISENGYYAYDPTNYHGPLHMYAVFVAQKLLGRDIAVLRLPAVLASLVAVWLMLRFGRFVGTNAARWAAAAMAVSPACVFYARYSIHESELLAFLLLTTWGVLELWKNGSRAGLFALIGGATGMVLTKETYFIHLGCLALAVPVLLGWQCLSPSRPTAPLAPQAWRARDVAWAAALGVFAIVFFYSGTFLHWEGVSGLWKTYAAWATTGVNGNGHAKDQFAFWHVNYYWLWLMARYEWPALIGLAACVRLLWPAPARLRYLAIQGAGALVAYTIIPYKTPWLLLVLLWPFFFTFGALVDELSRVSRQWIATTAIALAAACVALSGMRSVRLNFWDYANPREPYVYVQTFPEIRRFTGPLLDLARKNPAAHQLDGQLLLDSYYPLPWMLGDFQNVGYYKEDRWPDKLDGDFIATEKSKAARVEAKLAEPYYRREFRIRDAQEDCVAWFKVSVFRDELAGEPVVGPAKKP
jgi:uncharacterized protein (TIGR03663 family)